MIRIFAALTILLAGCSPEIPDMGPAIDVSLGLAAAVEDDNPAPPEPDPIGVCDTCKGKGYLGDGRIRVDCPNCDTPWESGEDPLLAKLESLEAQIMGLQAAQCPVPVLEIHDAEALAEALWEEFKAEYLEEFRELIRSDSQDPPEAETPSKAQTSPRIQQEFIDGYEAGVARASELDVPLVVVYTSQTCPPCAQLHSAQESVLVEDVVICRVWLQEEPELFGGIGSTPTQVFRYRGRELSRVVGPQSRNAFYAWLEENKRKARALFPG